MTLEQLADRYKLKIKKDSCGWDGIFGKAHKSLNPKRPEDNPHIYAVNNFIIGYLTFNTKAKWTSIKKRLEVANKGPLYFYKDVDTEGLVRLDPDNETLVKLFLRIARIRVKRELTEEQKEKIRARFGKKKS